MGTVSNKPTTQVLKNFIPLKDMGEAQLEHLASLVKIEQAAAGRLLIRRGNDQEYTFLLVEGQLRLRAGDGRIKDIKAKEAVARNPISQLIPRQYDVLSITPVSFIRISKTAMDEVKKMGGGETTQFSSYEVSGEAEEETSEFEDQISYRFLQDLESDQLKLPSLPEVAARIGKALRDDVSDAGTIAEMIQTDPVITAKLIKAANSAMYGRRSPVETCAGAVVRLGADVTHKLVLSFALRELFNCESSLLQQRMQELWKHSTQVAAICYVLAEKDKRFNPEHAMLVGLLHDIGVVAVLNYANSFPMEVRQPEIIDRACTRLRAQTGSLILRKWGFPPEFIVAALEGEVWDRNPGNMPDYCDLVIIAQLHSFVGTGKAFTAPAINEVPAHDRLALGELTPRLSLKILDAAKEQISHAQALLNI